MNIVEFADRTGISDSDRFAVVKIFSGIENTFEGWVSELKDKITLHKSVIEAANKPIPKPIPQKQTTEGSTTEK